MKKALKFAFGAAAAGAVAAAYTWLVRPWHVRWGSTREELDRKMPLDEVVEKPNYVTTRAVTVNAAAADVWPWLVQMGELPRAGFYTYAWIERLLGMHIENASEILADFQNLKPGDHLDRSGHLVVKAIDPPRFIVLGPPAGVPSANATWAIELVATDEKTTRLISRVRARIAPNARGAFWLALLDPGQFIMERKWLLGVKARAEAFEKDEGATHAELLDELVRTVAEKIEPETAPSEPAGKIPVKKEKAERKKAEPAAEPTAEAKPEEKIESLEVTPIGV